MLKIRLRRMGAPHKPFFRVVVSDSRKATTASAVEELGYYDPRHEPPVFEVDRQRIDHWVGNGAQMSATLKRLIKSEDKGWPIKEKKAKDEPAPAPEPTVEDEAAPAQDETPAEESSEASTEVEATPEEAAGETPAPDQEATDAADEGAAEAKPESEPEAESEPEGEPEQADDEAEEKASTE